MYADRYGSTGIKPGALSVAIGLNGAILAALIFSAPEITTRIEKSFTATAIELPKDPPPLIEKPQIKPKTPTQQRVIDPPPPLRPEATDPIAPTKNEFVLPSSPTGREGGVTGGTGTVTPPIAPPHVPVLIGAQNDPRFARALQPDYPPGEKRMGNEGRVTVRVLIGVDGRVKQVEMVSAASDAFFAATRKQALEKWRFKPATRDGIPEESWRTMSVTFVLNDEG